ncbi:MAG: RidA family protein [candidate division Zixibacteria bacterium]|jgi:2-iminobutanoate/2-iminopropanoate deaminase|nr:RidA family protein [candidate division Zixibacteria bacterium]
MKQVIQTDTAPAAIGPYSQAVKVASGSFVFCSGQIPLNPATMEVIGNNAAEQCEQVMKNIGAVLAAAGLDYGDVVKTTIFLNDMADFAAINEVYGRYFVDKQPARSTIQVERLPLDAMLEIEVIAIEK